MTTPTTPQPQPQQAIQRTERAPLAFVPRDMDEAWRFAQLLAQSSLIPDVLRGKPHDVLVATVTGAEIGVSPMQALREVHVVKGKPFIASLLRVALVLQSSECLLWQLVESTSTRATFKTQRRGSPSPTSMTYTMEDAILAGLPAQNSRYKTDPALQLRRRCAGRLIDEVYPDVVRGIRAREDMEEEGEEIHASGPIHVRGMASTQAPPEQQPKAKKEDKPAEDVQDAEIVPEPAAEQAPEQAQPAEPTLEEVLLAEISGVGTTQDLDAIAIRAKRDLAPGSPERKAVGMAINARRAEMKEGR